MSCTKLITVEKSSNQNYYLMSFLVLIQMNTKLTKRLVYALPEAQTLERRIFSEFFVLVSCFSFLFSQSIPDWKNLGWVHPNIKHFLPHISVIRCHFRFGLPPFNELFTASNPHNQTHEITIYHFRARIFLLYFQRNVLYLFFVCYWEMETHNDAGFIFCPEYICQTGTNNKKKINQINS